MNRKTYFLLGSAVVALALIGLFSYTGFPPAFDVSGTFAGHDTTLGAAGRAEPQHPDVRLILRDPDLVAALQNERFRTALAGALADERLELALTDALLGPNTMNNPALDAELLDRLTGILLDSTVAERIARRNLLNALTSVLADPSLTIVFTNAMTGRMTSDPAADVSLRQALANVLSDTSLSAALTHAVQAE